MQTPRPTVQMCLYLLTRPMTVGVLRVSVGDTEDPHSHGTGEERLEGETGEREEKGIPARARCSGLLVALGARACDIQSGGSRQEWGLASRLLVRRSVPPRHPYSPAKPRQASNARPTASFFDVWLPHGGTSNRQ
ncbi:hypothetical protein SKAU_G00141620 [Synaphobranchus kaupii]|uniref:Uncharacterized protein n=1 Tax=Synaphobranchus kaupii TaxID=118154 RepID=A0A9Q1J423_SYNKA|nr:hypothetical protein SKAU_G00141620 [Synaphobranchus kaupii]